MYINLELFFKALRLSLFQRRFAMRRWTYVIFFTALYWLMWVLVAFGRMLDHLFFPAFRRQQILRPVFIVAPPRSGTTLLQNLMSLDHDRFVHAKLYQTIFPSVCWQRFFDGVTWLDQRMGQPLAKLVGWAERKLFGSWDDTHKLRFDQPEEDDGFFVYSFVTEAIYLLFPYINELREAGFPDALPLPARHKLMRYYKSCLKRQLYANGPDKTLLSKATQSSGAVESLLQTFPDARFVTIIRHPYKSVASHVSVFYPVWRTHSPEITKDSTVSKDYAALAVKWYQHLFAFREKVSPDQYCCIDYRDLIHDPASSLTAVYQHFRWEMSDAFRARLEKATVKQYNFKSAHHYSLEEFGLSKEWIQEELGPLLDYYSLTR